MLTDLLTIRDFTRYAASQFNEAGLYYGHGTDNAWDDAANLILHTLHLPHALFTTTLDARLVPAEKQKLFDLITQRVNKRIPVPYLTHEAWFAQLPFYIDERVLIPRSPIAELIQNQFKPWINAGDVHDILDLCTGSGCIAIACAKNFPDAQVDATDISKDALAVAKINVTKHLVEDQVTLILSDIFANLPAKKYDIIVSNPPYVDYEDMLSLPKEFLHEPQQALAGGKDGLDVIKQILKQARQYLKPHGILVIEVGNSEAALIREYPHLPFTWPDFEYADGGVFLLTAEQLAKV
jgi:ribosomal protein L3 glutamine methyltransferase